VLEDEEEEAEEELEEDGEEELEEEELEEDGVDEESDVAEENEDEEEEASVFTPAIMTSYVAPLFAFWLVMVIVSALPPVRVHPSPVSDRATKEDGAMSIVPPEETNPMPFVDTRSVDVVELVFLMMSTLRDARSIVLP
jgi:hypothetical protein